MPLYDTKCECGLESEVLVIYGFDLPPCRKCGGRMEKLPAFPAMVKIGCGYPSRRKLRRGTAPYCGAQKALPECQ